MSPARAREEEEDEEREEEEGNRPLLPIRGCWSSSAHR